MIAAAVDPAGESRKRYTPWEHALSRAAGFEYAGAMVAGSEDLETARLIRWQQTQNGDLFLRMMNPCRN